MKECKNSDILPCYRDGYGVWHYLDDTHGKVYELNRQMCDLGKTMSDPMESLSEDTERAMLGCCGLLAKDANDAKCMMDDIVRRAEENIRLYNNNNKYARLIRKAYECKYGKPKEKDIMEEKKTKKMTKAEAFEYLKGKKVKCYLGHNYVGKLLLTKIIECGFKSEITVPEGNEPFSWAFFMLRNGDAMMLDLAFADTYRTYEYDEINAEELLSIKIVEDEPLDKWDEFARCVAKVQEKIEEDEVCIITKGNFLTMTK